MRSTFSIRYGRPRVPRTDTPRLRCADSARHFTPLRARSRLDVVLPAARIDECRWHRPQHELGAERRKEVGGDEEHRVPIDGCCRQHARPRYQQPVGLLVRHRQVSSTKTSSRLFLIFGSAIRNSSASAISGSLSTTSMRLPIHIEAIRRQNRAGLEVMTCGPGWILWMVIAPTISAMTAFSGMPSVSNGIKDVCAPALLADSGPATP